MRLRDKVAIITGAGRGIGEAIARSFAAEGCALALCARTARELEAVRTSIESSNGVPVLEEAIDVAKDDLVGRFVQRVLQRFGRIDVLVNNAGALGPVGSIESADPGQVAGVFDVNVIGIIHLLRHVLPIMKHQGRGRIINLAGAGAGWRPRPGMAPYAATKAAVASLTEAIGCEAAPFNIQVNALSPGAIRTRMLEELAAHDELEWTSGLAESAGGAAALARATELAVFLASEESGHVTGRLLSATWDDPRTIREKLEADPDLCTLRRIDGANFMAVR